MALTIKYTVTRSSDYKSISIADNGTAFGVGGEPGTGDVTAIDLKVYTGSSTVTPAYTVSFTAGEITTFTSGGTVIIYSTDSRWFELPYFTDGFYTTELEVTVSVGSTVTTQQSFDSTFYIKKYVMKDIAGVTLPIDTFYDANKRITGNLATLYILDYLSSILTVARYVEWTKAYNFLKWNYNVQ